MILLSTKSEEICRFPPCSHTEQKQVHTENRNKWALLSLWTVSKYWKVRKIQEFPYSMQELGKDHVSGFSEWMCLAGASESVYPPPISLVACAFVCVILLVFVVIYIEHWWKPPHKIQKKNRIHCSWLEYSEVHAFAVLDLDKDYQNML